MSTAFQITGTNSAALFTLKLHRGEGMVLLAMNWKVGTPSKDFVGFAIEYQEPGGDRFYPLNNRIAFPDSSGGVNPKQLSTWLRVTKTWLQTSSATLRWMIVQSLHLWNFEFTGIIMLAAGIKDVETLLKTDAAKLVEIAGVDPRVVKREAAKALKKSKEK
jgi:hypothetical protein